MEHAQPWPFPPRFVSPAATASIKSQQIARALGSYWDIIRVLVCFSGCFPIRGGTARIMDGADVWRKGMFGLHGQLMPCTDRCWGVKSVIPGMGDGETSLGSSSSSAPAPDCSSPLNGAERLFPKERLRGVLPGAAHGRELAPLPELLCKCRSQMGAAGLRRKRCSPRNGSGSLVCYSQPLSLAVAGA